MAGKESIDSEFKVISRKDQLGDDYEKELSKMKSRVDIPIEAFQSLDDEFVPTDGMGRNNSILALARDAKMKMAEHLENQQRRKDAVKASRAKYGFR